MKINYCPSYSGQSYISLGEKNVILKSQVLETQGLLTQLALHAGIHVEIPSYPVRLANYHQVLLDFDKSNPNNIFHRSMAIDSMSVAKTLLGWRDALTLAGWSGKEQVSQRLNTLGMIEENFQDNGLSALMRELENTLTCMSKGEMAVPGIFKSLEIEVGCPKKYLPDYIKPIFDLLDSIKVRMQYAPEAPTALPEKMQIVNFTDQYKAEAWLSQQKETDYDVWINSDNKRLDNWLHMSGKPVAGSDMANSNPQVTQMFLLAIQLFQRPLNVNTLLQYLYLPECPLPWELTSRLATVIVREGGFCNDKVLVCIKDYLDNEYKEEGSEADFRLPKEERYALYRTYLPFDLLNDADARTLADESDEINMKSLMTFLEALKGYVGNRAIKISAKMPMDLRIAQLREVAALIEALQNTIDGSGETIAFSTLQQWAQSLYDTCDFRQYNAQIGSRFVVQNPSDIVSKTRNTIWCDFYGDISSALSTDFLSPYEYEGLIGEGVHLWNTVNEAAYHYYMLEVPLHQTTDLLTFVVCKKQGTTDLPTHPLLLQLPAGIPEVNGDEEFENLPKVDLVHVDNLREEDKVEVTFDAAKHPVAWRDHESYSALENLLQNPLDYFMNYTLGFSDKGPTEIEMSLTRGNVAHETIESLFTAERGERVLSDYVRDAYEIAFKEALLKKGALLLLPEHHLECDTLKHQLRRCVSQLAEVIMANGLTVVKCEQEELQDLGFQDGIMIKGYIDMLLRDKAGKDVVFDLKWTSKKDKFQNLIKKNRAAQLAIYQAMLQQHEDHPHAARTAFFVMPVGKIVSSDEFAPVHLEHIEPSDDADIISQLRISYAERRRLISSGRIETSYLLPTIDIEYDNIPGVFPLENDGKKKEPKKADNEYSDYKCFTL